MRSNPKQAIMRKLNKRVQNVFVLLELIFSILCFFFVKILDKTKEFRDNCLCKERREKCGLL